MNTTTVSTSVLAVCIVFTALVTSLVFLIITCFTMRMKRFDILYRIENNQTQAKLRELDEREFEAKLAKLDELEVSGPQPGPKGAAYSERDVENMAPYYQIDLRGNLDKKVRADKEEADRKAAKRNSWGLGSGKKSIANISAPRGQAMSEEERIKAQLEAHRQLQDEQLQASYARFNSALNSGDTMTGIGGEMGTNVFESTGEMRSQHSEFEFFQRTNNNDDEILPVPQRSPRGTPAPASPASMTAGRPNALSPSNSMTFARRIEEPAPFGAEAEQRPYAGTLQTPRSRPGTPGTLHSMRSVERERQQRLASPEVFQLRIPTPGFGGERRFSPDSPSQHLAWQGSGDKRYNPHNMI